MDLKKLILQMFEDILEKANIQNIDTYFSKEYSQSVNGKELNYDDFKKHIATLFNHCDKISINVETIIQENNIVFTKHYAKVKKKDGKTSVTKVIAQFTLCDDKIILCDELTHLIDGDAKDSDLGYKID